MYTNSVSSRGRIAAGVLALALWGCATPQPRGVGPGRVEADGRQIVAERGGVRATVTLDAWTGDPRDLGRTLLPFRLVVVNGSPQMVRLPLERISLLDQERRQWRPLSPAEAHALASSGRGTSGPIFSFGIGGGSGGYGVGLGAGIPFGGSSGYPEIVSRGFSGGAIAAGSRVEGFVYFPRLDPVVSRFTLLLSPEGAEELSFDFAMGMR